MTASVQGVPAPTSGSLSDAEKERAPLWVLIPTYNDWDALRLLLRALEGALSEAGLAANVLIVDDGSTVASHFDVASRRRTLRTVEVLSLRRNLGHQRAIAVGLCHLIDARYGRGVVVMDGDGEDKPGDIPRLIAASERAQSSTTLAASLRRSEGPVFAMFYHLYCLLHRLLSGVAVRMGNFSYLAWRDASRLVICGELWNHYAAAIVQSLIPYVLVPCVRAPRLTGTSRMNAVSRVVHGLSAMAVFADRIGVRALAVAAIALATAVLGLAVVLAIQWSALAIPGWATTAAGLLLVICAALVLFGTAFAFLVLSGRSQTSVIPLRDYRFFISELTSL